MANNLGTGVSYVYDEEGYNYDTVVFQKGKPPLDSELNLSQDLINGLRGKQTISLPSGWVSYYPLYTNMALENGFYTQNPTGAKPEYALVNGNVIHFTNTGSPQDANAGKQDNANFVDLGTPPVNGNIVDGVILEVWRALLSPSSSTNKPDPTTVIDGLSSIFMYDSNNGWICGNNGLVLGTTNGGQTWSVLFIDTKRNLNGIFFATQAIGWVVGDNGIIARTSTSGSRWTLLTTGTSENLKSVHAISQLIAWAVGASGTILKTVNGINWTSQISGVISDLNKVHFHDQLVGWAVGTNGTILKTTDGGSNWMLQSSGTTQTLNSVYFYDLNYGFAVGNNGTILRSSDGGACWVSQSGNIFTGSSYTTTSEDLNDIAMVPTLDREEDDEEVSSQLGVSGKTFTVFHKPITKGDGNGTTTNDPSDVTVTVNGIPVLVDSVVGASGSVTLNLAPGPNAVTKISYYYKDDTAVFEGKAWIVGTNGSIFYTETIGAQWIPQTSGTDYDLLSASFINQSIGWVSGINSVIKNTTDGGTTWLSQQSDQFSRQIQRVFFEGNVQSTLFLTDNSIHPDVNIETTKRVQIQYRTRIISGADPASNPEAGLSSSILGQGPNASGSYPYENMGQINGDYGCWRAKCLNTVDGYVYAIPMFFINRRNSSAYDPQTNPNGSHQKNTVIVRPDLLTATNIVESDILDVRRRIVVPSITRLLTTYLDDLMNNSLKTNFYLSNVGGDRYGVELLQTDRIGGLDSNGGTLIPNITLAGVVAGNLSSQVTPFQVSEDFSATDTLPVQYSLDAPENGIFSTKFSHFKAIYITGPSSSYLNKPIPGIFSGQGTSRITFTFDTAAITTIEDPSLISYRISADGVQPGTTALTYVPSDPKLVKNFSGSGDQSYFYQGVLETMDSKVIESWASTSAAGYTNYVLAYTAKDNSDTDQRNKASTVEVHQFIKISNSGSSSTLAISPSVYSDTQDVPYLIYTIKRINNITAGFSHKLSDMDVLVSPITVTAATGYDFIDGAIVEIVAMALANAGDANIRNGATVNFNPELKKVSRFSASVIAIATPLSPSFSFTVSDGEIIGCSTTETSSSLNQPICFVDSHMHQITVDSGFGTSSITVTDLNWVPSTTVYIQLLVNQTTLPNPDDASVTPDGLLISYNYVPPQCQTNLPSTLSVSPVITPPIMYVSNLGSGGGTEGQPYLTPLQHIPIADPTIIGDSIFSNLDPLQFANFTVESGFIQLPVYVPGSFGDIITFSVAAIDKVPRSYYSVASKEVIFQSEGLQLALPRKVFFATVARVNDPSNRIYMHGEYVILIFSRGVISETENQTGYYAGGNCSISIYRLPNRPISRVS
jgi:photosystem II stability/assembly factor-like uncharacterized protein